LDFFTLARGLARGLHIAASFSLFGTLFYAGLLLRQTIPGLKTLAWVSLALALLAGLAWFLLQTAYFASAQSWPDITAAIPIVIQDTRFGALLLGRIAALIAATVLFQFNLRRAATLIAFGAVIAESWLGHGGAMTGPTGTVLLITSIFHLTAAACWLGSLPALLLALKTAPDAAALARQFSPLGLACVATLILTAAVQYVLLIASPAAFFSNAYGVTAFVKILLLAGLIALAARNRDRLTPHLPATRPQLLRAIQIEIAMGLLALLAAGLILQLEPPAMAAMAG
jgi:putative copper resistance protein D